jgi:hypothetical protein
MGTFRVETSTPSRALTRPAVTELTELEFSTFWQHWAPVDGLVPVGMAVATAARARRGPKNCMAEVSGLERGMGASERGCVLIGLS